MSAESPRSADVQSTGTLTRVQAAAVQRAQDYIDQHLRQPLRIHDIAAAACVSRYHLARLFRIATGMSPTTWLRVRRIDQARRWLREGSQPVGRIASELAFFDQSHFTRSFRAVTGCSPRHYARQQAAARFPVSTTPSRSHP